MYLSMRDLVEQERVWQAAAEGIGSEQPWYDVEGEWFGEEDAIRILDELDGVGNYELEDYKANTDKIYDWYAESWD